MVVVIVVIRRSGFVPGLPITELDRTGESGLDETDESTINRCEIDLGRATGFANFLEREHIVGLLEQFQNTDASRRRFQPMFAQLLEHGRVGLA